MIRTGQPEVLREVDAPDSGHLPEISAIITSDRQFQNALSKLPLYAPADLPILLTGEPGTGKELVAKAICALSHPSRQSCLRLNCAALTESLAGSELFGHVRGSFTDAVTSRPGKFRQAHRGTLFLDEVGDLPLSIQPRLLRAVEQGEIEPVGGDAPVEVDVRLIAATNQDLPRLIAQGRFRQDLYDRLAVLVLNLPPLRERSDDIPLLARHFARQVARIYGRPQTVRFSQAASKRLLEHHWPGNVRELKNVITRAVLLSSDGLVQDDHIVFIPYPQTEVQRALEPLRSTPTPRPSRGRLAALLEEESGNVSALSRRLRVCTKTIYRWLRSHRIDLMSIRGAAA